MLIISHRGNTVGSNSNKSYLENEPSNIRAITNKYDCEIDVWVNKEGIFLGHDTPNYKVDRDFFYNQRLWCHAKNLEALEYLLSINTKCFYHNIDDYTLTSNGLIWTYPGKNVNNKSIIVDSSKDWNTKNYNCFGICVDYIL